MSSLIAKEKCGCASMVINMDHCSPEEIRKWKAKAKRRGCVISDFQGEDWLYGPHRAGREAYKAALAAEGKAT